MIRRNGKVFGKANVIFLALLIVLNTMFMGSFAFAEDTEFAAEDQSAIQEEAEYEEGIDIATAMAPAELSEESDEESFVAPEEASEEAAQETEDEGAMEEDVEPSVSEPAEEAVDDATKATEVEKNTDAEQAEEADEAVSEAVPTEEAPEEASDIENTAVANEPAEAEDDMSIQGDDDMLTNGATVTSWAELKKAIKNAEEGVETEITISGSFDANGEIVISEDKKIILKSDGPVTLTVTEPTSCVEKGARESSMLTVSEGASLVVDGEITFDANHNSYVMVTMGDVTFNSGAVIKNGKSVSLHRGGGITALVAGPSANPTIILNGAEITGCEAIRGAGVHLIGGNDNVQGPANLIVNEGTNIHHNTAKEKGTEVASGGGIYSYRITNTTINGGTIANNKAEGGNGGGITVNGTLQSNHHKATEWVDAVLMINGGEISNNEASISKNTAMSTENTANTVTGSGGGVYIASDKCSIVGGDIHDNTAENQGGGVYLACPPYVLDIQNVVVTDNYAKELGGGIWFCPTGSVELDVYSGSAVYGNTADGAGDDVANTYRDYGAGHVVKIHEQFLGGGDANWMQDGIITTGESGVNFLGLGSRDASNTGVPAKDVLSGYPDNLVDSFALKSNASSATIAAAEESASVRIYNNTAGWGGGIGSNGGLKINYDDNKYKDIYVEKVWEVTTDEEKEVIPTSLKIKLFNITLDIVVEEVELNADNGWAYAFKGLKDADEFRVEEELPDGWKQIAYTTKTEVVDGKTVVKITIKNAGPKTIKVSKVDLNGEELPGAEIEIQDEKGTVVESWTSTEDPKEVVLFPGTYVFHEVAAPDGYEVVTDITFEVDAEGNVTITDINGNTAVAEDGTLTVTDKDAPKDIKISKVELSGEELPGASIEIRGENGDVVDAWTSGTTPHEISLYPGTYVFHEVAAPDGYEVVTDITFEVDAEGNVTIKDINGNTAVAEDGTLIVTDKDAPKDIKISKVELSGKELPGASIEIRDENGDVVDAWTSGTTPHEMSLYPGTYVFHEVAAPKGYVAVTDITFEVDREGNVTIKDVNGNTAVAEDGTLIVTDEKDPPEVPDTPGVEISKVDISGKELPGAKIEIRDLDGNVVEAWTSTTEPHAVVLPPGTYVFHEVAAPKGYVAVTDITFEVDKEGMITITNINGNTAVAEGGKLVVTDEAEPPEIPDTPGILISKVDLDGKELPGAEIEIKDMDGRVVAKWRSGTEPYALAIHTTGTIDEDSETFGTYLVPGTYIFHEVAAPNGYVCVTDITFKIEVKDGNTIITVVDANDNTVEVEDGSTLIVTDQKEPPSEKKKTPPKTGDDKNIISWVYLVGMSGLLAAAIVSRKRLADKL